MAYETGVAADPLDLINKLRAFLMSDPDLIAASENWTQIDGITEPLTDYDDPITLNSNGAAGDLDVTFGMRLRSNSVTEEYVLKYRGFPLYDLEVPYDSQLNRSVEHTIPLWNQAMNYWFIANGRRWMIGVEVSTVWVSGYCGLILPFGTPAEFPYPFFIAGITAQGYTKRYSDLTQADRFMASPGHETASIFVTGNTWQAVENYSSSEISYSPSRGGNGFIGPTRANRADTTNYDRWDGWTDEQLAEQRELIDGSYFMRQLIVYARNPSAMDAIGVLDGAFWISGRNQAPGNTIVDPNGDTHIVLQNGNKNTFRDFMTLRLT